jgi:hypothetical protein
LRRGTPVYLGSGLLPDCGDSFVAGDDSVESGARIATFTLEYMSCAG